MSVPPAEPNGPEPRPGPRQPRIGDAERDVAVNCLQEHLAQGRIDASEFDERLTRALQARTAADLNPLFDDLPDPRPGGLVPVTSATKAPSPETGASPRALPPPTSGVPTPAASLPRGVVAAMSAVWPATIMVYVVTDFRFWWLFVVAAMVSYLLKRVFTPETPGAPGPETPPRLDR